MTQRIYRIATALDRRDTSWTNKEISWEEMLKRLSEPVVTTETMTEFKVLPRDRQTEIKDVGGFVAGLLRDGRRRADSVVSRSMVTLDYDDFDAGQLQKLRDSLKCAWVLHSTHKHTDSAWRVRLVIPAERDMSPDEYCAVARRIAQRIGFNGIDRSTFEPCRLMFWPSRSSDAPYLFVTSEHTEPLNVDNILGLYHDWRDMSEWPLLPEEERLIGMAFDGTGANAGLTRGLGKGRPQENPLEKRGIVGTFCRCYGIAEAIDKFLPGVYVKSGRNRYTHCGSTTTGGAVVYDNVFLYSNHATDPCGGMLLNAWDLVRLHLFRDLDVNAVGKSGERLPSFKAMYELADSDREVKIRIRREFAERGRGEFEGMDTAPENTPREEPGETVDEDIFDTGKRRKPHQTEDWEEIIADLPKTKAGEVKTSIKNVGTILRIHPSFRDKLRMNDMRKDIDVEGRLPWRREGKTWSNNDSVYLRAWLDRNYGISGKEKISDALKDVANEKGFHPVREYLDSLKWDGEKRLERLITDVLGAPDDELYRRLTLLMFVAAVRRIRQPGCKFDYFVILMGPEGCGKSSLFSLMGGEWFSDSLKSIEGKEAMINLQGKWIIEVGELIGVKKSAVESVKAFISSQVDTFRPAYGEKNESYPRQCILVGTTNEEKCLTGFTGNRRQPVIPVDPALRREELSLWDYIGKWRDQLWAEANELEKSWGPLCLPPELESRAKKEGEKYNRDIQNPLLPEIRDYLDAWLPWEWSTWGPERRKKWIDDNRSDTYKDDSTASRRETVSIPEILQEKLGILKSSKEYYQRSREVGQLMKRMEDWEEAGRDRINFYGQQRIWRRKVSEDLSHNLDDV